VTGILTYRKYETADNQERYVSEIKATSFQICKPEENAVLPEMTM
jgi:single-stranded DNA-binding protein